MISANVQLGPLLKKLRQVPRETAQIMSKAVTDDARGFVKDIMAVTPPAMGKANVEAKKRGEAAVARDIRKVYATPGKLYEMIQTNAPKLAAPFWAAVKAKDWQRANRLARSANVPEIIDLGSDDGLVHQSRRKKGRVTGKQPSAGVQDVRYLKAYIKTMQARVGLLAAGFKPAALRLGASMPAWISRHSASIGTISVNPNLERFTIVISNRARHGSGNDLSRRIGWVLKSEKRKKRLQNSIRYGIRAALKKSQLQLA